MFILIIKQKASRSCITRQNGLFWQLSKISRMFGGATTQGSAVTGDSRDKWVTPIDSNDLWVTQILDSD